MGENLSVGASLDDSAEVIQEVVNLALGHEFGEVQCVQVAVQRRHRLPGFADGRDQARGDGTRAGPGNSGKGISGLVQDQHSAGQPDPFYATAFKSEVGAEFWALLRICRVNVSVGSAQVLCGLGELLLQLRVAGIPTLAILVNRYVGRRSRARGLARTAH